MSGDCYLSNGFGNGRLLGFPPLTTTKKFDGVAATTFGGEEEEEGTVQVLASPH